MSEIDQIKQSISIVDLVSSYVELKKAGINYAGRCPFHNEKTPSFYVSPDRGTFKCFGCGEGGDVFTFIEKIEGMDFKEALNKLADQAGVVLSKQAVSSHVKKESKDNYKAIMKWSVFYWQKQLAQNTHAIEYLKKRGFTKQMVIDYSLGYAPDAWEGLKKFLQAQNISESDMELVGLIKKGESGGTYDRFRDRIIFPLRGISGNTVAFSGRYIGKDDISAKYLNSPETPLFNKSKELYGLDTAKHAIRKNNFVLVVEGQVDLVMSQQVFQNTVATSGTSLTKLHLQSLKRFTDRIVFVFDSDEAGINAAYKASVLALEMDFEVRIAKLPKGEDPADIITASAEDYKKHIKSSEDVFDYWTHTIARPEVKPRDKTRLLETRIFPLLRSHGNALERDRYINHISAKLSIENAAFRTQLKQTESKTSPKVNSYQENNTLEKPKEKIESVNAVERVALLLCWQNKVKEDARFIKAEEVLSRVDKVTAEEITALVGKYALSEFLEEKMFELEKMYENSIILSNDINELIEYVSTYKKQKHQKFLMEQHTQAIARGDKEQAHNLLQELNESIKYASKTNN